MMKKIIPLLAMLILVMAACAPENPSENNTPAPFGTQETSTAVNPAMTATAGLSTFTGNVDELITMVNGFVTSGEITGNAENGLLAKLETIKQKVADGQFTPAANEMGAFVNEVQAQAGKKISTAAGTALIAKAQTVATELMAGIPVTGVEGTVVPATSSSIDSTMGNMPKPSPMGDNLKHQTQWDVIALQVVQAVGFSTFNYDLYQLPANTAWEDTLAYYKTQAAAAGWGDAPSQTNEMAGGHYAVWNVTNADGTTNYYVIAQIDTSDGGPYTLNIFGSK
jgi:hypothetical protein